MKKPFLYKDKKSLPISAETIVSTIKAIIDAGREEEFVRACQEQKLHVTASPKVINFVKSFLFDQGVHRASLAARAVVRSTTCPKAGNE
jgi:hypothetical protein